MEKMTGFLRKVGTFKCVVIDLISIHLKHALVKRESNCISQEGDHYTRQSPLQKYLTREVCKEVQCEHNDRDKC